jgi:hypothetical protein
MRIERRVTFKTFGVPSFASEWHENQELVFESTQEKLYVLQGKFDVHVCQFQ